MRPIHAMLGALLIGAAAPQAGAGDSGSATGNYSVGEYGAEALLQTCQQADNDSRRGTALEIECEQYLIGFADALGLSGGLGPASGICLPAVNAADEMRWAYVRWVHTRYTDRSRITAAKAVLQSLQDSFGCS